MRVQLVFPPISGAPMSLPDSGWWMPIGLLAVASQLKTDVSDCEIEILSSEVEAYEHIKNRLADGSADIVGINANIMNLRQSLHLAKLAKESGAQVVFGGHFSSQYAEPLLRDHAIIDYVVRGDGETALAGLAKKEPLISIPNLAFRQGERVRLNPIKNLSLAEYATTDYGLIDPAHYHDNFRMKYPRLHIITSPFSYASQRGCCWRSKTGGCVFCSRMEDQWRGKAPKAVWRDFMHLRDAFGMDGIIDVCDDFLGNQQWFDTFWESRPKTNRTRFQFIHSRASHITPETCRQLLDLNVDVVFVGVESGSDRMLRSCGKGETAAQQMEAVKLLSEAGIGLEIGFVLGMPGEDESSLIETLEFAKRVAELDVLQHLDAATSIARFQPADESPWHARKIQQSVQPRSHSPNERLDRALLPSALRSCA